MRDYDIGFLGGGQLARMSIQAAQRMGLRCLSLDPDPDSPASQVADAITGALEDPDRLVEVFTMCDRVTLENEFISATAIREARVRAGRHASDLTPSSETLGIINDKLRQRKALDRAGIPAPKAIELSDPARALTEILLPMVIKSRFGGYDGKGTRTIRSMQELEASRSLWESGGWLAEEYVPFSRELAVMVYRDAFGRSGTFPTMETVQTDHVCDLVFPAGVDASEIAVQAVEAVEGHGLFGVELFELADGTFQVNEIAPRPHNTGHYSLDWGSVSQFEQHVRLVMGWECARPNGQAACMANLLGQPGATNHRKGVEAALRAVDGAHVHWYGKAESRPGRKMGHINVVGADCVERAKLARTAFYRAWTGQA